MKFSPHVWFIIPPITTDCLAICQLVHSRHACGGQNSEKAATQWTVHNTSCKGRQLLLILAPLQSSSRPFVTNARWKRKQRRDPPRARWKKKKILSMRHLMEEDAKSERKHLRSYPEMRVKNTGK